MALSKNHQLVFGVLLFVFFVTLVSATKLPLKKLPLDAAAKYQLDALKTNKHQSLVDVPLGGSLSLLPTGAYFVVVAVGSPPQPLLALLDSGSSDFLVTTVGCEGCNKPAASEYDQSKSTSVESVSCNSTEVQCKKCDGDSCLFYNAYITCVANHPNQPCVIEGPVLHDTFSIPGTTLKTPLDFGAITFMNITFPGPMSAIWGITYSTFSAFNETGPFQALVESGQINNLFALCILQENGTFSLGNIDHDLYVGEISYTPLHDSFGYSVKTVDIKINGESLGLPPSEYNKHGGSIIDSGTFSLMVPDMVYRNISERLVELCKSSSLVGICGVPRSKSLLNGGCFAMTEQDIDDYPDFEVLLDGVSLNMGPHNYLVQNYTLPSTYCYGIQNGGEGSITILGDTVLKNMYTIFDIGNKRVGFASANLTACASS